jgi:hypothetical protein
MATQLCQKCKQVHPGRVCDSDDKGECAETIGANEVTQPSDEPSKRRGRLRDVTSAKREVQPPDESTA